MPGVSRRIPREVSSPARVRVWDLPTRVFHWSLVALVAFSFASGTIGRDWLEWHMKSGYAVLALLLFRLAWGFMGSETARFSGFVRGPRAALAYARDLWASRYSPGIGHNPLGGWMVVVLLATLLLQAMTGLFVDDEIATQGPLAGKVSNALVARMTAIHHYNEWLLVAAIGLHLAAVAFYRLRLGTDLVSPMLSGWMAAPAGRSPPHPAQRSPVVAAVLLALAAGFVYWLVAMYPKG
jgi:cytochrome b